MGDTLAVLVFDSATEAFAVALGNEQGVLASTAYRIPRAHSRLLQPAIAHLLTGAGLGMSDITMIGVGVGPGSYTGVRLGVSTAKAMAVTLGVPLVPIPTLAAISAAAMPGETAEPTLVVPLLFARRGRAFGAIYRKLGSEFVCITPSTVQSVARWCDVVCTHIAEQPQLRVQIVHDFLPSHGVLAELDAMAPANRVHLQMVIGTIGLAMLSLVDMQQFTPVAGEAVHHVVPEYALEVEAEVQLRERRQSDGE